MDTEEYKGEIDSHEKHVIDVANHTFRVPEKQISSPDDLKKWEQSQGYSDLLGFILTLNEAVKNKKVSDNYPSSPMVGSLLELLEQLEKWIGEIPPIDQPQRFGNKAFRTWFTKLKQEGAGLVKAILPPQYESAVPELFTYLVEGVGNETRIDYGTGHELSFVAFLCCLCKIGAVTEDDHPALVLKVFERYLNVMRRLQLTYRMEPAGSHGVWSLDDYQFLPFLWGSSQLMAAALKTCLLEDLRNPRIMVQLWALGIIGKVFSGPWMSCTYSSKLSSLELGPFVQCCLDKINGWMDHPEELLQPTTNVFNQSLDPESDSVLTALMSFPTEESIVQVAALQKLLKAVQTVLNQQMVSYLTGEFATPSKSLIEKTQCAPTNNMESERALGLLDNLWRKAPNATLGFLSGKVKCKLNKTMEWLEMKTNEERHQLINFAVSEARHNKIQCTLKKKNVMDEVEKRRQLAAKEKESKKRNGLAKKINSAFSKEDISKLESLKQVHKMKSFLKEVHSVVGKLAMHSLEGKDYYMRLIDVKLPAPKKKSRIIHFCASYWLLDEREANAIDHKISAGHFFADVELDHPRIKPKSFPNQDIYEGFYKEYLFLSAIKFINQVKTGPFAEHSNQLWGISGVPNWSKVNSGLIKMYRVEVLAKFPVIQHFLFGSLLTLDLSPNPVSPVSAPPQTSAGIMGAMPSSGGVPYGTRAPPPPGGFGSSMPPPIGARVPPPGQFPKTEMPPPGQFPLRAGIPPPTAVPPQISLPPVSKPSQESGPPPPS